MRDEHDERQPQETPRESAWADDGGPPDRGTEGVPEGPPGRPADPAGERPARPPAGGPDDGGRPVEAPADGSAERISELEDKWRRALADLDNYRKRAVRALDQERAGERARTSAEWLPVLDNLERALEHADAEPGAVIQGVRSVLEQARDVICRLGYPRRDDMGQPFDPARHEAVATVADSSAPDGTVVAVLRPGYGEGTTQLRPAQVVVAQGRGDGTLA
jgi:molecular chaperone GrpE